MELFWIALQVNWGSVWSSAFASILVLTAGGLVHWMYFKAVTEEKLRVQEERMDAMEESYNERFKTVHDRISKKEDDMMDELNKTIEENSRQHQNIINSIADNTKITTTLVEKISYIAGKLDQHIKPSK